MYTRILEESVFWIRRVTQICGIRVDDVTIPDRSRAKDGRPVDRRSTDKPAFVSPEDHPFRPNKAALMPRGKAIQQIIGSILSADTNIATKTEVDEVRRRSKIVIAGTFSVWSENPSQPANIGIQGYDGVMVRRDCDVMAVCCPKEHDPVFRIHRCVRCGLSDHDRAHSGA